MTSYILSEWVEIKIGDGEWEDDSRTVVDGSLADIVAKAKEIPENDWYLYEVSEFDSEDNHIQGWKLEDWLEEIMHTSLGTAIVLPEEENKGMALITGNQFDSIFSLVCISCGDSYGELFVGDLRKRLAAGQDMLHCPACEANTCDVCQTIYPSGEQLRPVAGTNFIDKACTLCLQDFSDDYDTAVEIAKRQKRQKHQNNNDDDFYFSCGACGAATKSLCDKCGDCPNCCDCRSNPPLLIGG